MKIILKQLFTSDSINIVEYLPRLRLGKRLLIFISPSIRRIIALYLNLISHEFELNTALKKMLPLNKCHIDNNVFSMF